MTPSLFFVIFISVFSSFPSFSFARAQFISPSKKVVAEKSMSTSAGEPAKIASVEPIVFYSNYKFEDDHGSGANLWIWRVENANYVGLFHIYEGDLDVQYAALSPVNDLKINAKTNEVSFSYQNKSYDIKGTESFSGPFFFKGKILNGKLGGKITGFETPLKLKKMESIPLARAADIHSFFKRFSSVKEWEENTPPKKTQF